jgi:hypothetical protein
MEEKNMYCEDSNEKIAVGDTFTIRKKAAEQYAEHYTNDPTCPRSCRFSFVLDMSI